MHNCLNSRELADTLGLVDTTHEAKRAIREFCESPEDQSDPAPWWVVALLPLFALVLVGACALFVRYVVPMIEAVL